MAGGARRGDGRRCSRAGQAQSAGSGAPVVLLFLIFFYYLLIGCCTRYFVYWFFPLHHVNDGRVVGRRVALAAEAPEAGE